MRKSKGNMSKRKRIPYQELDKNIIQLVRALNAFKGITTIGSCGGHAHPKNESQWPKGSWYIKFFVARDEDGRFALEFLAWLINHSMRRGGNQVYLYPTAAPPYLNSPGEELHYVLEGNQEGPDEVARLMNQVRKELYIRPKDLESADDLRA
jgi:hypothetical protein